MSIVMDIAPDGTVNTLYTEAIKLESLGPLKIERASTIEFNDQTQEWEVRFINKDSRDTKAVYFSHKSRAACLQWEIEQLNEKLLSA
jgi:hypothetical protein